MRSIIATLCLAVLASTAEADSTINGTLANNVTIANSDIRAIGGGELGIGPRLGHVELSGELNLGTMVVDSSVSGSLQNTVRVSGSEVRFTGVNANLGTKIKNAQVAGVVQNSVIVNNSDVSAVGGARIGVLGRLGAGAELSSNVNLGVDVSDSRVSGTVRNVVRIDSSTIKLVGTDANFGVVIR